MATNQPQETIQVIVRSAERPEKTYHLPTFATVDDVAAKWENDFGFLSSSVRYLDEAEGILLSRQDHLSNIKQWNPGEIKIIVEEVIDFIFLVLGVDEDEDILVNGEEPAWPSETLSDLLRRFCENWLIDDRESTLDYRSIEISHVDSVLDIDLKISSLSLKSNPVVCLRVPISLCVVERWSGHEFLFEDVNTDDTCDEFRAVFNEEIDRCLSSMTADKDFIPILEDSYGEIVLSGCDTLGHHLKKRSAPRKTFFKFCVDIPKVVWLLSGASLRCMTVGSSKRLSTISGVLPALICGVLQPPDVELSNVGLEDDEILSISTIDVILQLTSGFFTHVVLPVNATVIDLQEEAACIEKIPLIRLRIGSRYLKDNDELLINAGIRSGSCIKVERSLVDISVSLGGSQLLWHEMEIPLSFTTIEERLRSEQPYKLKSSDNVVFICVGCGRKLSKKEEQYQKIPANCCSKKSTELQVLLPCSAEGSTLSSELTLLEQRINELYKMLCDHESQRIVEENKESRRYMIQRTPTKSERRYYERFRRSFSQMEKINIAKLKDLLDGDQDSMAGTVEHNDNKPLPQQQNTNFAQQQAQILTINRCTHESVTSTSSINQSTCDLHGGRSVKLLIFYNDSVFKPKRDKSKRYDWSVSFIKCDIYTRTDNGFVTFKDMCAALDPIFASTSFECTFGCRCGVRIISQMCGCVGKVDVSLVTSQSNDELAKGDKDRVFCDIDGNEYSWKEVESPNERQSLDGDKILVFGTDRRTVLWIHP